MKFANYHFLLVLTVAALFISNLAGEQPKLAPTAIVPTTQIPEGLSLDRFADENQVSNPTALCIDEQGRVFVAETHRWRVQVQDIRHAKGEILKERLEDDMSCRTTGDRIEMHKKWSTRSFLPWEEYTSLSEKIRLLVDTDGDGKADQSTYFRDDFNDPLSGTSGGILARDGTIYLANIPGIYALRDEDDDGVAEKVHTLADGFGVRISFSGHDMNGFAFGPDGKLYWSIGDRGYHVEKDGKKFSQPDSGAIFRSNPDGSQFEVFYHRLRNPKEITFDDYGNLFTVDNDYDNGDNERIVYLVEHGDSGWQMGYQTLASFGNVFFEHQMQRKKKSARAAHVDPWMAEAMWMTQRDNQPAYILPPVALSSDGPGGFTFNPGVVALPSRYQQNFFIVNYGGATARCSIENFSLKPSGAGFSLGERHTFLKGMALTDLDWGFDGKLYLSDFVGGWVKPESGNVYTISEKLSLGSEAILEVEKLVQTGFAHHSIEDLVATLAHADQRIRQRAQLELAGRPAVQARPALIQASQNGRLLSRLHALWGLGQIGDPQSLEAIAAHLESSEMELRANAARTLGNHGDLLSDTMRAALIERLTDSSARVVSLAAIALANHGHKDAIEPALDLLVNNADKDPILRHAGVMVLVRCADVAAIGKLSTHSNTSVRVAATVALRRLRSPLISQFFDDASPAIVIEAVRGAYDENIVDALPAMADRIEAIAKRIEAPDDHHPITPRRAIYAGWRLGQNRYASAIASLASNTDTDIRVRRDAFVALLDWNTSPIPDPVCGTAFPLPKDRQSLTAAPIKQQLAPLFETATLDPALASFILNLAQLHKLEVPRAKLVSYLSDKNLPDPARVSALELLANNPSDNWAKVITGLLASKNVSLRSRAREMIFEIDEHQAFTDLENIIYLTSAVTFEKQAAIRTLQERPETRAGKIISKALSHLAKGELPKSIGLELVTAAEKLNGKKVKTALAEYRKTLDPADPAAEWKQLCATGGNAEKGQNLLHNHGAAQCMRCHSINSVGGNVAPSLSTVGKQFNADYLIRSLVTPSSEVAVGYGIITITLKDGTTHGGIEMPKSDDGQIVLKVGEELKSFSPDQVISQTPAVSAMPPMMGLLSKSEARDLVAYLITCKEDKTKDEHK